MGDSSHGSKTRYRDKELCPYSTYHVFNRRDDRKSIFLDIDARGAFVDSMKRLLDPDRFRDSRGRMARPFDGDISLLAFCLMDNHFHLVLRQHESRTVMSDFMKRLTTSYALNQKTRHGRTGPLFDRCYQAVRIESDQQLKRTIAYVHANLATPLDDRWSSHSFYMTNHRGGESRWLDTRAGLAVYGSRGAYLEWFMRAVEARRTRR